MSEEEKKITAKDFDIEGRLARIPEVTDSDTMEEAITRDTISTLARLRRGVWDTTAYLDEGADLYEDFVKNHPDYYPYKGEIAHIKKNAENISRDISHTRRAIVIGQGPRESFEQKELEILKHCPDLEEIVFIDVSEEYNKQAVNAMHAFNRAAGRDIRVQTHTMNFMHASSVLSPKEHTTVLTAGSLIANVPNPPADGLPETEISKFLLGCAALAGENGQVVIGYDSNNMDIQRIEQSYICDKFEAWITNIPRNFMRRMDIEGIDPNPEHFEYEGEWNYKADTFEHRLKVLRPQQGVINAYGTEYPINLRTGDTFLALASIKPSSQRVNMIGRDLEKISPIWLETANIYQSGDGIVEHVFNIKSSQEYERPDNGRGRLVQDIERRLGIKPGMLNI